jgi:hypothetical protein
MRTARDEPTPLLCVGCWILQLAAIEQRLGVAERLADCIEDPRASERVRHGLAEMVRYRALLIARGYPDGTCSTTDTDRVHGAQQLSLFNAHYDSRCFHRGVVPSLFVLEFV